MDVTSRRLARNILGGSLWTIFGDMAVFVFGFAIFLFLTRRLGPSKYGLYALAASIIIWIEISLASFFDRATVKLVSQAEDWRPVAAAMLRRQLAVALAAAGALVMAAYPLAYFLDEPALFPLLCFLALDIPINGIAYIHNLFLMGLGRFRERALVNLTRWSFRLMATLVLVGTFPTPYAAAASIIACTTAALLAARCFIRPPLKNPARQPLGPFLAYAVPLFVTSMATGLFHRLDLILLKALGRATAFVGVYSAAQNLGNAVTAAGLAFSPVVLSFMSRAYSRGDDLLAKRIGRHATRLPWLFLPLAAVASGASSYLVRLLLGGDYAATAGVWRILVFAGPSAMAFGIAVAILTAAGRPRWAPVMALPMLAAAAACHAVIIPRYGLTGAASVTVAVGLVFSLGIMVILSRLVGISPPQATILRNVALSVPALIISHAWIGNDGGAPFRLAAVLAMTGLAMVLGGEIGPREVSVVRALFSQDSAEKAEFLPLEKGD